MRCAIVSDIHANLEALEVVLAEIDSLGLEPVYCLGDLVGYNADPDLCVRLIVSRAEAVVRGNHDKAADEVFQLADIPRPMISLQTEESFRRETDVAAFL